MTTKKEESAGGIVYRRMPDGSRAWLTCKHSLLHTWGFPKGLIGDTEADEPMEQAAIREVREEGGVTAQIVNPQPIDVHYAYRWHGSPHGKQEEDALVNKTVHYFLMEYVSGDPNDHDWEMTDAKFVTEAELRKILHFPSDVKAFEEAIQFFKPAK